VSATKERYQNPVVGDDIRLRLLTYNSNNLSDLYEIEKVEIFRLDEQLASENNPDGLYLVDTFQGSSVVQEDTGTYLLTLPTEFDKYLIGTYYDIWTVRAVSGQPKSSIRQKFEIYPDLWYSTPIPVVYDFDFRFQPNKFRKGSKQFLIIEIIPNVPTAGDLRSYYENLAIVSNLKISMQLNCGECNNFTNSSEIILEDENVDYREKRYGYYKLDTEDLACGIYDIWFKLEFGGNIYISDKFNLQVYD